MISSKAESSTLSTPTHTHTSTSISTHTYPHPLPYSCLHETLPQPLPAWYPAGQRETRCLHPPTPTHPHPSPHTHIHTHCPIAVYMRHCPSHCQHDIQQGKERHAPYTHPHPHPPIHTHCPIALYMRHGPSHCQHDVQQGEEQHALSGRDGDVSNGGRQAQNQGVERAGEAVDGVGQVQVVHIQVQVDHQQEHQRLEEGAHQRDEYQIPGERRKWVSLYNICMSKSTYVCVCVSWLSVIEICAIQFFVVR